jgi:hypothetical protein
MSPDPFTHPAFDAARDLADLGALAAADRLDALQAFLDAARPHVTNARGQPLRLVEDATGGAAHYERRVHDAGQLAVRPATWHDRFNVLAWRLFPRAKAALNDRHVTDLDAHPGPGRSRLRDALTLFDEDGLVVAVADPRLEALIRAFRWRALFVDHRAHLASRLAGVPVGHALMEKLRAPFVGLTAKALFVPVSADWFAAPWCERLAVLDAAAAAIVGSTDTLATPRDLAPLPVLGLPGWWAANEDPGFYDDATHFRPGRRAAG